MSLLSICTEVCGDLALAVPGTIVGNTDETATRLLAAAQLAGESLARQPENGWVDMITEYDFVTSATAEQNGTITNSGPGGVAVISGLTLTNASVNPVAENSWYAFGTGVPNNAIVQAVHFADPNSTVTLNQAATQTGAGTQYVFGQSDYTLPSDFERVIDNTLWDRSRFWSMRGPQSAQQWQLYKSSVIGRASIQRRFRFRQISGVQVFSIDPVPTDNNSALVFEYVSNAWCESDIGTHQNMWMADTDVGILDEYLITLGVRWRMYRRLGFAYQEELAEYERQVSKAMAKDGGQAILDMTPNNQLSLIGPWNLPETGFGGPAT
jgi:hypothetical protein